MAEFLQESKGHQQLIEPASLRNKRDGLSKSISRLTKGACELRTVLFNALKLVSGLNEPDGKPADALELYYWQLSFGPCHDARVIWRADPANYLSSS